MYGEYDWFTREQNSKRNRPSRSKYPTWFHKLTLKQLNELVRAAKLSHSGGTKDALIDCLSNSIETEVYIHCNNKTSNLGLSVGDLKELCKEKLLATSGSKFDLVLRLLHKEFVTGTPEPLHGLLLDSEGNVLMDENGKPEMKKRAKSVKPIDLSKLEQKMWKMCYPNTINWSKRQCKNHCVGVMEKAVKIITDECVSKGFVEMKDPFALEVVRIILVTIAKNIGHGGIGGIGYCAGIASVLAHKIKTIIDVVLEGGSLTDDMIKEHALWIKDVDQKFRIDYNMDKFHFLYGHMLQNEDACDDIADYPLDANGYKIKNPNFDLSKTEVLTTVESTYITLAMMKEIYEWHRWVSWETSIGGSGPRILKPDTPLIHR